MAEGTDLAKSKDIYSIKLLDHTFYDPEFTKKYQFYFPINRTFIHSKAADNISPTAFKLFILLQDRAYTMRDSCMVLDPTTLLSCREHVEQVLFQLQQNQLLTFSKLKEIKGKESKETGPIKIGPEEPLKKVEDQNQLVQSNKDLLLVHNSSVVQKEKRKRKIPKEKENWTPEELAHTKANEKPKLGSDQLISMWEYFIPKLPAPKKTTASRDKKIKKLIENHSYEEIETVLQKINSSSFCNGKNDRSWKANFDFFLNEEKFVKALEGAYDDKNSGANQSAEPVRGINLDTSFE